MSRLLRILLGSLIGLFILACGLVTGPISDVEKAASTAESFASALPINTIEALATNIPIQTLEALPSEIPDYGNYFSPEGTPVEQWNDIPIMPQATVGQEFNDKTYSYTVPLPASDVQAFYDQHMEALGWTSSFGFQPSEEGGILLYQKDSEFLTITMVADQDGSNGVDVLLQKQ
jgi:hypothetical protein